jgi:hypothetical protein
LLGWQAPAEPVINELWESNRPLLLDPGSGSLPYLPSTLRSFVIAPRSVPTVLRCFTVIGLWRLLFACGLLAVCFCGHGQYSWCCWLLWIRGHLCIVPRSVLPELCQAVTMTSSAIKHGCFVTQVHSHQCHAPAVKTSDQSVLLSPSLAPFRAVC